MSTSMTRARELAGQCWCDPETSMIEMDSRLANAFARRYADLLEQQSTAPTIRALKARVEELEHQIMCLQGLGKISGGRHE